MVKRTLELPVRSYRAALLLTGSARRAESAVRQGVQAGEREQVMWKILSAAVRQPEEVDTAPSALPEGLRAVFSLPRTLRHCFVLRVLEGLPAERCGELLRLKAEEVNALAADAASALAEVASQQKAA